jgi:hypothetical protein
MTTLSNVELLEDSVANNGSLKNERLSKTARSAQNPNPNRQKMQDAENTERYADRENESYAQKEVESVKKTELSTTDDDTILGMKPAMFYTILTVGVILGGIFVYKKFIQNKGAAQPATVPASSGKVTT